MKVNEFLDIYRLLNSRGLTDEQIDMKLESMGLDYLCDIPPEKIPPLVKWAEKWNPGDPLEEPKKMFLAG
jgi:hypothetical protein